MNYKNHFLITTVITISVLSACSSNNNQSKPSDPIPVASATKASVLEKEKTVYLQDAKPIDYTPKYNSFTLNPVTENKAYILSGSTLIVNGKTLSGTILTENTIDIYQKGTDWYYKKGKVVVEDTKKNGASAPVYDEIQIQFIKGFSKMKFLGKKYDFVPENLTKYGQTFDFTFFVHENDTYVIEFENAKEKSERQTIVDEYDKKVKAIKDKYGSDPYMINTLTDELDKAYNIKLNQL